MIKIKKEKRSSIIITVEIITLIVSIVLVCLVMGIIEHNAQKRGNEFSIIYKDNKNVVLDNGGIIVFKPNNTKDVKSDVYTGNDNSTIITYAKKKTVNRKNDTKKIDSTSQKNEQSEQADNMILNEEIKEFTNIAKNEVPKNNIVNNTDENNINTSLNTNTNTNTNKNTNTNINTNTNTNTNTMTNTNIVEPEPEIDRTGTYWVEDKKIVWENNSILGIFNNSRYNMKNIIAPGSTSTYTFYVNNKMGFDLNYVMTFSEENDMHVNMMYKLKREDEYIVGDENTWEYYDSLYIDYDIANDGRDKYVLEWKWIDTDNDTEIGVNHAREIYKLNINILATQISGLEEENQDGDDTELDNPDPDDPNSDNPELDDTNPDDTTGEEP